MEQNMQDLEKHLTPQFRVQRKVDLALISPD